MRAVAIIRKNATIIANIIAIAKINDPIIFTAAPTLSLTESIKPRRNKIPGKIAYAILTAIIFNPSFNIPT